MHGSELMWVISISLYASPITIPEHLSYEQVSGLSRHCIVEVSDHKQLTLDILAYLLYSDKDSHVFMTYHLWVTQVTLKLHPYAVCHFKANCSSLKAWKTLGWRKTSIKLKAYHQKDFRYIFLKPKSKPLQNKTKHQIAVWHWGCTRTQFGY
jgi:hypothetical protein